MFSVPGGLASLAKKDWMNTHLHLTLTYHVNFSFKLVFILPGFQKPGLGGSYLAFPIQMGFGYQLLLSYKCEVTKFLTFYNRYIKTVARLTLFNYFLLSKTNIYPICESSINKCSFNIFFEAKVRLQSSLTRKSLAMIRWMNNRQVYRFRRRYNLFLSSPRLMLWVGLLCLQKGI